MFYTLFIKNTFFTIPKMLCSIDGLHYNNDLKYNNLNADIKENQNVSQPKTFFYAKNTFSAFKLITMGMIWQQKMWLIIIFHKI